MQPSAVARSLPRAARVELNLAKMPEHLVSHRDDLDGAIADSTDFEPVSNAVRRAELEASAVLEFARVRSNAANRAGSL